MPHSKIAYGVVSNDLRTGITTMVSLTPTKDQKEIARILGLDPRDLAKPVALNSANGITADEYVSMNVRDMPLIAAHARTESYQPISEAIAAKP